MEKILLKNIEYRTDRCFLCGIKLNSDNRTEEHIFPKWLLKKYNIVNGDFQLFNGTKIKYSKMKVPCCNICNNNILSNNFEKYISKELDKGYKSFVNIDKEKLFLWLNKIYFSILYKENSLKNDLTSQDETPIVNSGELKERMFQRLFLQGMIQDRHIINLPASVIICKLDTGKDFLIIVMGFFKILCQ